MDSFPTSEYNISKIEISYHNKIPHSERIIVNDPNIAYSIFRRAWDFSKIELLEQFKILLLDRGNHCLGVADVSTGGVSLSHSDPRIIFSIALLGHASGIILAHNHPSGTLMPSPSDKVMTERLQEGGRLLDIPILDHLILTKEDYFSFAQNDLMVPKVNPVKVKGSRRRSP
ncbi:JAB domain-containing protein [Emticicia fluvialis]|uniref:JAB domain-containing protein n=1 Tax=Emticicia fluvialis TaxID=2974474 RepID=UPI0021666F8B|nr:JAB domain-containing protein [Emticicia fluvialis]